MFLSKYLIILISIPFLSEGRKFIIQNPKCGPMELTKSSGEITSPGYPHGYPDSISCTWLLSYPIGSVLNLRVTDLDIEEDQICSCCSPCCTRNWLSFTSRAPMCGHNVAVSHSVTLRQNATVKFLISKAFTGGRGFRIAYYVCKENQFHCADKLSCVDEESQCDGKPDCQDGSDEWNCNALTKSSLLLDNDLECRGENVIPCGGSDIGCYNNVTQRCNGVADCPNTGADEKFCGACGHNMLYCKTGGCYPLSGWCDGISQCAGGWDEGAKAGCSSCRPDYVSCGPPDICHCYNPRTQRCDGQMDCPHGADEVSCVIGCDDQILCATVQEFYSQSERCDGVPQCSDQSDERGCSTQAPKFRCSNTGRCIDDSFLCDGKDDCGDGSDEADCIKNSVVTVVVMGSLACGLIAVLGVACGWRYYSSRNPMPVISINNNHQRQIDQGPLDEATLYHLYREPPPSYHEAVLQGASTPSYCHPTRYMNMSSRSGESNIPVAVPRRPRPTRTLCDRPRLTRPLPKPPQILKPLEDPIISSSTSSQVIQGDQYYPEAEMSTDQDTPMLELSDNNVSTSGADISNRETDSRSPSGTSMSSLVSCESHGSYQAMS